MMIVVAVGELAHVELAGGGALLGAVGLAVDHQAAGAADALAAVVVERDRLLALVDQALVDDVEHLEERHVVADAAALVGLEAARIVRAVLAPDLEGEVHVVSVVQALLVAAGLGEVDVLEHERLLVAGSGVSPVARPLPGADVGEVLVVAQGLALVGLVLHPEVAAAGLLAVRASRHISSAELEEVGDPAGLLEGLVDALAVAEHPDVLPELLAQGGDLRQRLLEAVLVAAPCRSSPTRCLPSSRW